MAKTQGLKIVLIILLVLAVGAFLFTCLIGSIFSPESITPKPAQITPTKPSPTESLPPEFKPITLSGSDSKTSAPFKVLTSEWIIQWRYTPDDPQYAIFSFFIYPRGETLIFAEAVLFPKKTFGLTYSYAGAGEYYVKVQANSLKSWEIIIKPP